MPNHYTISPQDIADRIQGFSLTAHGARPDAATLQSILDECEAVASQFLLGKGVAIPDAGTPAWLVVRACVIDMAVSKAELIRNRGTTEMVNETWERVRDQLRTIRDNPAMLDGGGTLRIANTSPRARAAVNSCGHETLLQRMARSGKL